MCDANTDWLNPQLWLISAHTTYLPVYLSVCNTYSAQTHSAERQKCAVGVFMLMYSLISSGLKTWTNGKIDTKKWFASTKSLPLDL